MTDPRIITPENVTFGNALDRTVPIRAPWDITPLEAAQGLLIETWNPVVDAIHDATQAAFDASPEAMRTTPSSPAHLRAFQEHWHAVFTRLAESVAADNEIPTFLTAERHVTRFFVNLFNEPHDMGCPCCLPDVCPAVFIERAGGVTKTDLVIGLRDYLFGGGGGGTEEVAPPQIYDADDGSLKAMPGALVRRTDWISSGTETEDGGPVSYYENDPLITMYCCPAGQYADKSGAEDDEGHEDDEGQEDEDV